MIRTKLAVILGCLILASITLIGGVRVESQNESGTQERNDSLSSDAGCDPLLPIKVELVPLNKPEAGKTARFEVKVESVLDPDLVGDMRMEYELPSRVQRATDLPSPRELLARSRANRLELGVISPDESRYAIRARLIVRLSNGKTISQTAVQWVDPGAEDAPEGMIGRIVDADGTGTRVYQGLTVRN